MAIQQSGNPREQRGRFPRWIWKIAFSLTLIFIIAAGVFWIWKVWGSLTDTLSAIFTALGTICGFIGLLSLFHSSQDSQTPASSQPPSIQQIFNFPYPQPSLPQTIYSADSKDVNSHSGDKDEPTKNQQQSSSPEKQLIHTYSEDQFIQDKKAYAEWLEQRYRIFKLGIIRHLLEEHAVEYEDPSIGSIFVPVQSRLSTRKLRGTLSLGTVIELLTSLRKQAELTQSRTTPRHLVLLGGPGRGKSTLIQYLVWGHAAAHLFGHSALLADVSLLQWCPIPLYVDLSQISFNRTGSDDFLSCTIKILQSQGVPVENTDQFFKRMLSEEETLLLLDGLDEIIQDRQFVIEGVEELSWDVKRTILVTSRVVGYYTKALSTALFSEADIQSFDKKQIHLFLDKWYKHTLTSLQQDTQQEQEVFYKRIVDDPRLYELATNPLLLTIMTALYHQNPDALPHKRVQIYEQCARTLLEHWTKVRGSSVERQDVVMSEREQYLCAGLLGYEIHQHAQRSEAETNTMATDTLTKFASNFVSEGFILDKIEHFPEGFPKKYGYLSISWPKQAEAFFELMQLDMGLIVKRGTGRQNEALYSFVHRTFQEYFAAVYVYERYHQKGEKSNSTVIKDFLQEYLHDPHWYEIILLLFEKLERKLATEHLRQILEGKIKSHRSKFHETMQQDLFFVSSCLEEEITVEDELAEQIISLLSEIAKRSPFPSQREDALKHLDSLIQTQLYNKLAQNIIVELITKKDLLDIPVKRDAASILYLRSLTGSKEQQQGIETLLDIAEHSDPIDGYTIIRTALVLCWISPQGSEEQQLAIQTLLNAAQRPEFSVSQVIQGALEISSFMHRDAVPTWLTPRILLRLAERPNLSVEEIITVAQGLYQRSAEGSKEKQFAHQMLLALLQRADLSVGQLFQGILALYLIEGKDSKERENFAQKLLDMTQHIDLAVEQVIQSSGTLYEKGYKGSKERRLASRILLLLAKRSDLSIEQAIQASQVLFRYSSREPQAQQFATEKLLALSQRPDLSNEQAIQAALALYRSCSHESKEERFATEQLIYLAQHSETSITQIIQAALTIFRFSFGNLENELLAARILWYLTQRSYLVFEQNAQAHETLNQHSFNKLKAKQQVMFALWRLTYNPKLTTAQRLLTLVPFLEAGDSENISYEDKAQAVQLVCSLLEGKEAKKFLAEHWKSRVEQIELPDLPPILQLAKDDFLPTRIRNDMYWILKHMIPQFDKMDSLNS